MHYHYRMFVVFSYQQLCSLGDWDDANTEKVRLEEKQRAKRREREAEEAAAAQEGRTLDPYRPTWFARTKDAQVLCSIKTSLFRFSRG